MKNIYHFYNLNYIKEDNPNKNCNRKRKHLQIKMNKKIIHIKHFRLTLFHIIFVIKQLYLIYIYYIYTTNYRSYFNVNHNAY